MKREQITELVAGEAVLLPNDASGVTVSVFTRAGVAVARITYRSALEPTTHTENVAR